MPWELFNKPKYRTREAINWKEDIEPSAVIMTNRFNQEGANWDQGKS